MELLRKNNTVVNFIISQVPYQKAYVYLSIVKAFFFLFTSTISAQKIPVIQKYSDTLILRNKDRIIGEIKKMDNGVVLIETDYSDNDFSLKWIHVESINTFQNFLIILSDGTRYNSNLGNGASPGKARVQNNQTDTLIDIEDIVFIHPIEKTFFSRFTGALSIGFNYTKSDNLKQLSIDSNIDYTNKFLTLSADYSLVVSSQDDADYIKRMDGGAGIKYFLKNDYFLTLASDFLSNTEQKINLRLATNFGYGKYFVRNNHTYFGGAAGLVWNNESFSDEENTINNSLEAFGSLELNMFDIKDFNLLSTLTVYPSITEEGRFRADFSLNLKYNLPLDFFIKLGGSYNYDNKPVEGASKDDYVIQATFGWEKK